VLSLDQAVGEGGGEGNRQGERKSIEQAHSSTGSTAVRNTAPPSKVRNITAPPLKCAPGVHHAPLFEETNNSVYHLPTWCEITPAAASFFGSMVYVMLVPSGSENGIRFARVEAKWKGKRPVRKEARLGPQLDNE
jgi:hypothetical protein